MDDHGQPVLVRFVLSGFPEDPDTITNLVGVVPTTIWRQGEPFSEKYPSALRRRSNAWVVESEPQSSYDPSEALQAAVTSVLEKLRPGWTKLVELPASYHASFNCRAWIAPGAIPSLSLSAEAVHLIDELHSAFDIDVYLVDKE
jgi:hypothetical protein